MAITMYVNDDPNASGANVVFMTALGLALVILALILYRPLFQKHADAAGSNGDPRWTRRTLVVLQLLIAFNAIGGSMYAFGGAPDVPREWLEGTPFDSYLVPGLILLVAVGGAMTIATGSLLVRHPRAPEASIAAGLVLIGWITVQMLIIVPEGSFSLLQPTMVVAGLVIIAFGWRLNRLSEYSQPVDD
jgi:hypothetical protein